VLADKYIRYGSSPRGAQALVECGRVYALMNGRYHLAGDDIRKVAPAVSAGDVQPHRALYKLTLGSSKTGSGVLGATLT